MSDANVVKLLQPGSFGDPLTEVLRNGARALLAQAIEAEVAEFLAKHSDLKTASGLGRVVRHGHLPEREVMTGIGPVGVRQPRVRDRGVAAENAERIRFTPVILPPYTRRSRSLEVLIPILYLKGISTGDFEGALAALLGKDAPGLSASTIARLKEVWLDEHEHWRKRDLSAKRYVYMWADGIYLQGRLEDTKQCILVIIGATPEGRKELLGFTDGTRESAQDWRELLLDLKNRGLAIAPELAVADGALGFWKALSMGLPLNRLLIPPAPPPQRSTMEGEAPPAPRWAMPILAVVFAATAFVTGAMAAHLPRLLEIAGASATMAIAASALVGPAQVGVRLVEFGALRMAHPLVSARLSTILHPLGAAALALFGPGAVMVFAVLHGAGNGLLTIARGTVPLAVFGPVGYGLRTGLLSAPARATQALGPLLFGLLLDRLGTASVAISAGLCLAAFCALFLLKARAESAPAVA